jgi:hypothetical protein
MFYWQCVMLSLLAMFLLSCLSHFAQHYQMTVDNEDVAKLKAKLATANISARKPTINLPENAKRQQVSLDNRQSVGVATGAVGGTCSGLGAGSLTSATMMHSPAQPKKE